MLQTRSTLLPFAARARKKVAHAVFEWQERIPILTSLKQNLFPDGCFVIKGPFAAELRCTTDKFPPLHNNDALDAMVQGQIDLSVGYFDFPANRDTSFIVEDLYSELYVFAGRRGQPLFSNGLTLDAVAQAHHLLVSPYGPNRNLVDHALHLQGLKRNIQTVVPSLFAALSIIENSDFVVTLPSRVAQGNAHRFDIVYALLPIDGGSFQLHAVRHIRDANNPLHIWLLEKLRKIVSG